MVSANQIYLQYPILRGLLQVTYRVYRAEQSPQEIGPSSLQSTVELENTIA
jgi:hypothetical protein